MNSRRLKREEETEAIEEEAVVDDGDILMRGAEVPEYPKQNLNHSSVIGYASSVRARLYERKLRIHVQVVGGLEKQSTSSLPDHFVTLYVDEKEVLSRFHVTSAIKIGLYRRGLVGKHLPGKKYLVSEFKGQGIDLMDEGTERELANEAGESVGSSIIIKLDAAVESRAAFMDTVNRDIARLGKFKGADGLQLATPIGGMIGTVLKKLMPIIDNFASTHPVLNLSWLALSAAYKVRHYQKSCRYLQGLKLAFQAVQNQTAEDDTVRDLVESLREMAGAASQCPDLLVIEGTVDVIEEIGRTSLDIALLIHRYASPSIEGKSSIFARTAKYAFTDMSSQITSCKGRCAELTTKLSLRLQIETNDVVRSVLDGVNVVQVEVKEVQMGMKGIQDDQKKRDIDKWISAPDSSSNYKTAREKHQEGTGSWLVNGSVFRWWKESPGTVLWLHGGRENQFTEYRSSSAVEDVKNACRGKSSTGYAYFFFDGTSAQSKLAAHESLVRSSIMQLSDQFDGIPPALVELYEDERNGRSQPLIGALENTLLQILQSFDTAYIVVDALDECFERSKVLKWIQTIASQTSGNLHLMVTSRPEPDIKDRLRRLYNLQEIDISTQQESDDIRHYIDARLSEVDKWTDTQKERVRYGLSSGADGVFRWVALQFDLLVASCESLSEIEHRLRSLPRDLDEAYAEIIKRSPRPAELILFLQWIIFGLRSFTAQELAEVALINFGNSDSILPFCDPSRRYGSSDVVLSTCYGLVVETKGSNFSIRTSESLSHQAIAKTCLAYLLQFYELDSITPANIQSFPLAMYAVNHCVPHINHIRSEDMDSTLKQMISQLAAPNTYTIANWSQMQDTLGYILPLISQMHLNYPGSELYSASKINFMQLVDHLIEHGRWGTALQEASEYGDLRVFNMLLSKGADVNAVTETYGTALQAASCGGELVMVGLLLEVGADVNVTGGQYGTALQAASFRRNIQISEMLLEAGADPNVMGGQYGTALQAASVGGDLDIVQMLLEAGADVNVTGGEFGTALQAASWRGSFEIALALLDEGADTNVVGGEYGTALQAATHKGHLEIAKLLLERGADANMAGGPYGDAFNAARAERDPDVYDPKDIAEVEAMVQLLKDYGAVETVAPTESDET
ncbi:hypothetical protein HWV62_5652 [Athelia sp. TMB]|nr:hypothetical protein HWV62_5652 [Athelia sp. TMB]